MENKELTISYQVLTYEELNESDKNLIDAAREATYTCYAPYSNFHVGAAVRMSNQEILKGSNQENAAFGAGTCAERTTLFYAHAHLPKESIEEIAIAARGTNDDFTISYIAPCGICRQALLEAEKRAQKPIRVLLYGKKEIIVVKSVSDLLPFQFNEIV